MSKCTVEYVVELADGFKLIGKKPMDSTQSIISIGLGYFIDCATFSVYSTESPMQLSDIVIPKLVTLKITY